MVILVQHTGERGRPPARVLVEGKSLGVVAARLYLLLQASPAAASLSNAALSAQLGYDGRTIIRGLDQLESAGLITRQYDKLTRRIEILGEITNGYNHST